MGKPNFFFNYTKTPSFSSSQWKAIRPLLILMLHQTKSKSCSTLAKEESHSPQLRIIRLADVLRNHQCLTQSLSSHQFFLRKNYGEPKMMPKEDKKKKSVSSHLCRTIFLSCTRSFQKLTSLPELYLMENFDSKRIDPDAHCFYQWICQVIKLRIIEHWSTTFRT